MKKINKVFFASVLGFALILTFTMQNMALAVVTPSLGLTTTFGILSSTYTNTVIGSTINGDVGYVTGPATTPTITGTTYVNSGIYAAAGADQGTLLTSLSTNACTFTFATGAVDLATDTTHGATGVYTPGVYCSTGAMDIGTAGITLNGGGVYIFRPVGALTSTTGSSVTLSGASACDVFWTPTQAATLANNTSFTGNIVDDAGITIGSTVSWIGRALAFGGTVTTDTDTITVPTCTSGVLHVIKSVVNDNAGILTPSNFSITVKHDGTNVLGSPAAGAGSPGTSYSLSGGTYVVSEVANSGYTKSYSGDCDANGVVNLASGADKTCTITNNDIVRASSSGSSSSRVYNSYSSATSTIATVPTITTPTIIPKLPKTGFPPLNK